MAEKTIIKVPDIGGATQVDVIEILVKPGDEIKKDMSLVTLESDKASMEIPSPEAGRVVSIELKVGDKVSQGDAILSLEIDSAAHTTTKEAEPAKATPPAASAPTAPAAQPAISAALRLSEQQHSGAKSPEKLVSAGPAVRRLARELGVDLVNVSGSGRNNRVSKEDVQQYVKQNLHAKQTQSGYAMPEAPVIDFSQFGPIDSKPLNKIKRLTGLNLHRSWITVPHVTQFDEADITDLEAFRKQETEAATQAGYKLTLLAFVTKALSKALREYPQFNSSLDASGQNLIYKQYYNIGIAVDTPNGLVVPVIKQVNGLSLMEIAQEMARLSQKARDKTLMPGDMSGGCFTISSLGGVGGTAFTPIVNTPEVAILGLSRASIQPVYSHGEFKPRLILPLSLSYDHRVIDGAEAARFTRFIAELLQDIRRVLL